MSFMDLKNDIMDKIAGFDSNIYYIYITLRKNRVKIKEKNTCFFLKVFIR